MSERSIPELIEAYRQGDEEAQRELMDLAEPMLVGMLRTSMGRDLRSLEDSMDLAQSVLLGFHVTLRDGKVSFENEAAMAAFLKQMASNKMANRADAAGTQKRGGGTKPVSLDRDKEDEAPIEPVAPIPTPSHVAESKETQESIGERLTEEEQAIFEGYMLGRTNREIADDLGRTPDAVRMIWFRARQRLVRQGIIKKRPQDD